MTVINRLAPLALLLPLLGACATTNGTASKSDGVHYAEGGDVVVVPVKGAVGVAFRIVFYSGSADDPAGKEGLTKLTALLMAEGGTEKLSYSQILKVLYPLAASIDVQVDKEQTVFSGLVHPDHVDVFVPLLADVIRAPRMAQEDLTRLQQNLKSDIENRLRATDDENFGKALLESMIYPAGHPYHHFVGGTVAGLDSITLDDVIAHRKRVFGRARLVIGLAGAVDSTVSAKIDSALAELFEGEPRIREVLPAPESEKTEVLIAHRPQAQAVAVSIGYAHGARRGHPDFTELALVQSYFGEHRQFHGILMAQMRGMRGLNYGDYAYVENFEQEGWGRLARTNIARRRQHFEIWIRPVAPDDAVFSIRIARLLLDKLVDEGLTQADVDGTNEYLQGYSRLWEMTSMRRLGYALDDHFYGIDSYLSRYRTDLAAMKAADVNDAIRAHLKKGPLKIAIVAPDAEALKAALIAGAPSKKTYPAEKPKEVLQLDAVVAKYPLGLSTDQIRIIQAQDAFSGK